NQEVETTGAGGRPQGGPPRGSSPALADKRDADAVARIGDRGGVGRRFGPQGVIVVRGDQVTAPFPEQQEQRRGVGATRKPDQNSPGGGDGWDRTSDSTIMSRVLYH